jgi:alpha-tubulin suppressor-like RCC1 family protein
MVIQIFPAVYIPTQIGSANNWASISAGGSYSIALKSDTLWAWGDSYGALGDGTNIKNDSTQIGTDTKLAVYLFLLV